MCRQELKITQLVKDKIVNEIILFELYYQHACVFPIHISVSPMASVDSVRYYKTHLTLHHKGC